MISDEVRQAGLAAIAVAAAMLVEAAHEALVVAPTANGQGPALAVLLARLGADFTAFAAAAAVFAQAGAVTSPEDA